MTATKPSSNEEEYFAKQEIEKKRKLALEIERAYRAEERDRLREVHQGHCSKCGMELQSHVFKGVMLEKCYNCGAVVLDADEFEKLAGEEDSLLASIMSLFRS